MSAKEILDSLSVSTKTKKKEGIMIPKPKVVLSKGLSELYVKYRKRGVSPEFIGGIAMEAVHIYRSEQAELRKLKLKALEAHKQLAQEQETTEIDI